MSKIINVNVANAQLIDWSTLKEYEFNSRKDQDRDVSKL